MSEVALWYWRHYAPAYELCDSEEEAAELAVAMQDSGEASIAGIQFPNRRVIQREEWPAYKAAEQRMLEAERSRPAREPRPSRRILDPFRGQLLTVDEDAPAWLGKPKR